MNRHRFITFEPLPRETSAVALSRVLRSAAAGAKFKSPLSEGISPAAAKLPPPTDAAAGSNFDPARRSPADMSAAVASSCGHRDAVAADNHFSFGSGPSNHKPGSIGQGRARNRVTCSAAAKFNMKRFCIASGSFPNAARSILERGKFAQSVIDVCAVGFAVLFAFVSALAVVSSFAILFFVRV